FTLTVTNSGPSGVTGVAVTDLLPSGYTYVSDDGLGAYVSGTGVWTVGALASGASATLNITASVNAAGVYNNTAEVTAANESDSDSTPGNGITTEDDYAEQGTAPVSAPLLAMTQTVTDLNGGSLNPGDTLRYTIVVTNSGTAAATSINVTDPVPASTTLVAGSLTSDDPTDTLTEGASVLIDVGTLDIPGFGDNDVVITYDVTVDVTTPGGTVISNQASLTATGPMSAISDDPSVDDGMETGNDPADTADDDPTLTAQVTLGDVLQVSILADKSVVRRGDFVLYTVTIENPTVLTILNVTLENTLSVGANIVRGTVTLDGVAQPDPAGAVPVAHPIGTLLPAQTRTLVYRAVVNAGSLLGELENRAVAVDGSSQSVSLPASHTITLLEDPEFDLGTIIGKVFDDRDGDGVQDVGEIGIGGAMVAMEDGVYTVTDVNGMYHITAVRPGNRLVKINRHTLPSGHVLTLPEAQTVTMTPGLLAKVNFGVKKADTTTTWPGRPGVYGVSVANENIQSEAEVIGNLDDMTAVINGVMARLPKTRVKMDVMSLERNLRIVNGKLEKPALFTLSFPRDRRIREWVFEVFDAEMRRIRGFRGKSRTTKQIHWNGKDFRGSLVKGGSIYQYQLTIEFADGSLSKSPLKMFGVNRTNAIAFELTGASFETNTAVVNNSAMIVLSEVAATFRKHVDEKVVIRGHTDSTGTAEWNARLSLERARAVQSYLVAAGIHPSRMTVEALGSSEPVESNDTPAGRARNRRVQIKAQLEDTQRARTYASTSGSGQREVIVNDEPVPVGQDGSFRAVVDPTKKRGRVYVGIKAADGSLAATTVTLPTIRILEPKTDQKIEIGKRDDVIRLMQPRPSPDGPRYPAVRTPVRGLTNPGNQLFIDGDEVAVDSKGRFKVKLPLAIGQNTFGIVAIAPNGYTSLMNLSVNLTGVDENYGVITLKEPVPKFSLELPPRGAVLSNPNVYVRGKVPRKSKVVINNVVMGVRPDGLFGGTVKLPEGPSFLQATVTLADGTKVSTGVPVTVKSNYLFVVALGDATVNKITTEGLVPEQFEDDLYVDGRLALYVKGRIQGKYLLSAGLDTGDGRLSDIGSRLDERDNRSFYRNLDPDAFYPVYGDGSQTVKDTNSQGRFYVLFEAPASSFQWGNYNSGITGNEFSSFNRSLYGAKAAWKSLSKLETGESVGQAIVFAALPETRAAHDEFIGTGGSLYFLRNQRVVPGSEKIRLEVRDKITGIPVANVTQRNYVDYEVDYAEGRILFRKPVSSVADSSTLISDGLLNGNPVFILVDYEYSPLTPTSLDDNTYGARLQHAIGEHLTLGATYVEEERLSGQYTLQGGDFTIRAGEHTRITAEFSQSENEAVAQYISTDGGLSFAQKVLPPSTEPPQAYRFELSTGRGPVRFTGYMRHIDAGFSSS
ncbi:MAG: OmpA family protein, partial [Gemmatimonadota bacterium]